MRTLGGFKSGFGNDSYCKIHIYGDEDLDSSGIENHFIENSRGGNVGNGHDVLIKEYVLPTQEPFSKFGQSSWFFPRERISYLEIGDATSAKDWTFGSGDFTIDSWIYFYRWAHSGSNDYKNMLQGTRYDYNNYDGLFLQIIPFEEVGADMRYIVKIAGTEVINLSFNYESYFETWTHIAIIKRGSFFGLYANGELKASTIYIGSWPSYSQPYYLGNYIVESSLLHGYIDEFRLSKGIARWNNEFSPPTRAYGGPKI